ncbi:hypothetical protein D3C73_769160 [compost metagenome]
MALQFNHLFPAATKNKRIPTLQAYHPITGQGQFDQQVIDLLLRQRVAPHGFSHVNAQRLRRQQGHYRRGNQTIEHHHVRLPNHP